LYVKMLIYYLRHQPVDYDVHGILMYCSYTGLSPPSEDFDDSAVVVAAPSLTQYRIWNWKYKYYATPVS
jgi:hypothetical protein